MSISRRELLAFGGASAVAVGLAGCSKNARPSDDGTATLSFAWWGNPVRDRETNQALDAYRKDNPNVTIKPQTGGYSGYWEKLATQTAAKDAPDVIQMDLPYLSQYATNGTLLDLSDHVDVSKFAEGAAASGTVDGRLVGISAGLNAATMFANPLVFKQAGVQLPDDKTWTWDDYRTISAKIQAHGDGLTGTASEWGRESCLRIWLRQHEKDLYTPQGELAFSADDLVTYFNLMVSFEEQKAMPSPSEINEEAGMSSDQQAFIRGKQGFSMHYSNQIASITEAVGTRVEMLRLPTVAGSVTQLNAWYQPSMLWSIYSKTKFPEAASKLVDWWVNSTECADICLDERGVPANTDIAQGIESKISKGGKRAAEYLDSLKVGLGKTSTPPPPGSSVIEDVLERHISDVLFERDTVESAAQSVVDELNKSIANAA